MDDDTEIERMLDEKMQEDVQKKENEQIINRNGDKKDKDKEKDKDKDKDKKHKKHKHHKHKSHKSEKKHDRKRSRSPRRSRSPTDRRHRSPPQAPTLPSGKRRDVNSELHQLAKSISRQAQSKENLQTSKANKREKSPELTPEERDLRTVFCKNKFTIK